VEEHLQPEQETQNNCDNQHHSDDSFEVIVFPPLFQTAQAFLASATVRVPFQYWLLRFKVTFQNKEKIKEDG
jgi:hypothetical protein